MSSHPSDIVFVCDNLGAGGIQRVVSVLANEWSRRGRKVTIVTRRDGKFFDLNRRVQHIVFRGDITSRLARMPTPAVSRGNVFLAEVRRSRFAHWRLARMCGQGLHLLFLRLPFRSYLTIIFVIEALALRSTLIRVKAPIVVSMGTQINVLTLVAAAGLGRRVVVSERSDATAMRKNWIWGGLTARLYRAADMVTANSRAMVSHMREFVSPDKLAFVPNPAWIEGDNGFNRSYDDRSAPILLFVGRLIPDKAPDVLLEAFALCVREIPGCRLAFVGKGMLEPALRAQAASLGIAESVDWYGFVGDPLPHYSTAQVFVLPSRFEGTPNALLEAMGCGLPVIVSDGTPGPLEVVEHDVSGLVVPVNDPRALADALFLLLSDATMRRRLGMAARERVLVYELSRSLASWEAVLGLAS